MSDEPVLDYLTMTISRHAIDRYLERRGGDASDALERDDADWAIRDLLSRVAHRNEPIYQDAEGRQCRRYVVGELAFLISTDCETVITMYTHNPNRPKAAPRPPSLPADVDRLGALISNERPQG